MLARLPCVVILVLSCLPHRVDHALNCVKGGGACHLREKVLAEAAKTFDSSSKALLECSSILFRFILVADYRKNVRYLGTNVGPFWHNLNTSILSCLVVYTGRTDRSCSFCLCKGVAKFAPYPRVAKSDTADGNKERCVSKIQSLLLALRSGLAAGPVVTDNGNFIIDAPFGREHMVDPYLVGVFSFCRT